MGRSAAMKVVAMPAIRATALQLPVYMRIHIYIITLGTRGTYEDLIICLL